MKLKKLKVENLRGIADEEFSFYEYTSLIGPNNSGKSTIIRALQIFLNQVKPDAEEWNKSNQGSSIVITGEFNDIQDWERDIPGISSLIYNAEIKLRLTIPPGSGDLKYEAFIRDEHIEGWSDSVKGLSEDIKEIMGKLGINGTGFRNKSNQERIREHIRRNRIDLIEYGDPSWTDEGISIKPALKQGLPRVEIIPAIRNARDEGRLIQKKNIFRDLLDTVIYPAISETDEYQQLETSIANISERLKKTEGDTDAIEKVSKLNQNSYRKD